MNVVYNQNKPEDAWYLKLSNLPKPDEINYNVWNGEKQISIKGLGTKENPNFQRAEYLWGFLENYDKNIKHETKYLKNYSSDSKVKDKLDTQCF